MTQDYEAVGLYALVHGESGVGKSWLGYSTPGPRLVLDAEGRTKFIPRRRKLLWNPKRDAPPSAEELGDRDFVVAYCDDWQTLTKAYAWLAAGQHPFRSVVLDSITELQKKTVDDVAGIEQPDQGEWGQILRTVEDTLRKFRDLTLPSARRQLDCCLVTALTFQRDGKFRPFVKGQLVVSLPGFVDLVGYLYTETPPGEDTVERKLLVSPHPQFLAKDGTDVVSTHYGPVLTNPDLSAVLRVLNESE